MVSTVGTCCECGKVLPPRSKPDRLTCSDKCRTRRSRQKSGRVLTISELRELKRAVTSADATDAAIRLMVVALLETAGVTA